ncbi:MAG: hypothetical protein ACOC3Z_01855 [Nanoarchaeota archaeon]
MQEINNLIRIFRETKVAFENYDSDEINRLSNQTNNTISKTQDQDNITTAVVVYALGKIIKRESFRNYPEWKKFHKSILRVIDEIIFSLEKKDEKKFRRSIKKIIKNLEKLPGRFKAYVTEVFRKASINKAERLYEHGISMEKTASLLGITMYEIAEYAGSRKTSQSSESNTISVRNRIKFVKEFFA